jgi:hypothetical protein
MSGKNPNLTVVTAADSGATKPPHPSGREGLALWHRFLAKFRISDPDDLELLLLACEQLDQAAALRLDTEREGRLLPAGNGYKENPAVRLELHCRGFVARTLRQLGAAVRRHHQQRGPGRPGHGGVGWTP